MKVGLLECDNVVGRFPELKGGYREMFAALLPRFTFRYYAAHHGQLPPSASECDAWLCTGSKYSVYDGTPWIANLAAFIRSLGEKRFVGICFGHQMLAHAMGGQVAKAKQGWGVGVLDVEVLRKELWMDPPLQHLRIQHMHQDQVQRLPEKSLLLGKSAHCEVAMFRVGETMLGSDLLEQLRTCFLLLVARGGRHRPRRDSGHTDTAHGGKRGEFKLGNVGENEPGFEPLCQPGRNVECGVRVGRPVDAAHD